MLIERKQFDLCGGKLFVESHDNLPNDVLFAIDTNGIIALHIPTGIILCKLWPRNQESTG